MSIAGRLQKPVRFIKHNKNYEKVLEDNLEKAVEVSINLLSKKEYKELKSIYLLIKKRF